MSKLLVFVLAFAVYIAASSAYLTPLYPIYAQGVSSPAPVRSAKPATTSAKPRPLAVQAENAMEKMEDKMATRAAELKAKLQKFRDKNKAGKIENINTNLTAVNKKATDRMQSNLQQISAVLTKVESWIADQEASGKDMSQAKTALTAVESDWSDASDAVAGQADNDYTIVVNTEATVKTDAQTARNKLRADLKVAHDEIISVRQGLASLLGSWKGGTSGQ